MLNRFLKGLVFGSGFSLAFLVLSYLGITFILPNFLGSQEFEITSNKNSEYDVHEGENRSLVQKKIKLPFHELGVDDLIFHSSVIALAEYKPKKNGKIRAIITEIIKKEEGTDFYYEVGDEYHNSSFYPKENTTHGDGLIIFFTGSPSSMRMSMTYSGGRISSLGNIPIKLLRQKCNKNNA